MATPRIRRFRVVVSKDGEKAHLILYMKDQETLRVFLERKGYEVESITLDDGGSPPWQELT